MTTAASTLAICTRARRTCNPDWSAAHQERIDHVLGKWLPHGSGFDQTPELAEDATKPGVVVLKVPYHHMNEHGFYDGWSVYTVRACATFDGHDVRVTGGRKAEHDYIAEQYRHALFEPRDEKEIFAITP